jgi:hypothetical protein
MTEAPIPIPASLIETASNFLLPPKTNGQQLEIPERLIGVSGCLGNERGAFMEGRVQAILSAQLEVEKVIRNKANGKQDSKTHDLTVFFADELGIEPINIQVKSSFLHVEDYRRRIRRELRARNSDLTADEWLIMDRTIALNGAKTKDYILKYFAAKVAEISDRGSELNATHRYLSLFRRTA